MIEKRTLTMSIKEIERYEILKMANEKQITQQERTKRISVSECHFRSFLHNYRMKEAEGMWWTPKTGQLTKSELD